MAGQQGRSREFGPHTFTKNILLPLDEPSLDPAPALQQRLEKWISVGISTHMHPYIQATLSNSAPPGAQPQRLWKEEVWGPSSQAPVLQPPPRACTPSVT